MKKLISGPKIGELNGGWAFLLKVFLVILPIDLMFRISMYRDVGTIKDLAESNKKCIEKVDDFVHSIDHRLTIQETGYKFIKPMP